MSSFPYRWPSPKNLAMLEANGIQENLRPMTSNPLPIFDGHNDTLLRLYRKGLPVSAFFERGQEGHVDLPRAKQGGFAGGLFACFVPSDTPDQDLPAPEKGGYSVPFPGTPAAERALAVTNALAARLQRLARASGGEVTVCRSVADIRASLAAGSLAAVLHIEGAEAIDPEMEALEVLHAARPSLAGPGLEPSQHLGSRRAVPLPSSPDTGPGPPATWPSPATRVIRSTPTGPLLAGAEPVPCRCSPSWASSPILGAVPADVAARARVMLINYPNNPTGGVIEDDFFERAVEFARRNEIILVHDNAYSEITPSDGYHAPSFLETPGAMDVGIEIFSLLEDVQHDRLAGRRRRRQPRPRRGLLGSSRNEHRQRQMFEALQGGGRPPPWLSDQASVVEMCAILQQPPRRARGRRSSASGSRWTPQGRHLTSGRGCPRATRRRRSPSGVLEDADGGDLPGRGLRAER